MNIPDREKRRARNIIWNAAREYGFEPPLKVFDPDGRADLYWNSIIGAARRCYGAETVDALFDAIRDADHEEVYEQLLWLGLENAVYQRETRTVRRCLPCGGGTRARSSRAAAPFRRRSCRFCSRRCTFAACWARRCTSCRGSGTCSTSWSFRAI